MFQEKKALFSVLLCCRPSCSLPAKCNGTAAQLAKVWHWCPWWWRPDDQPAALGGGGAAAHGHLQPTRSGAAGAQGVLHLSGELSGWGPLPQATLPPRLPQGLHRHLVLGRYHPPRHGPLPWGQESVVGFYSLQWLDFSPFPVPPLPSLPNQDVTMMWKWPDLLVGCHMNSSLKSDC